MEPLMVGGTYREGTVELDEIPESWESPRRVQVIYEPPEAMDANITEPAAQEREAARKRLLDLMREGLNLGGPPYPKREELYDRVRRLTGDG